MPDAMHEELDEEKNVEKRKDKGCTAAKVVCVKASALFYKNTAKPKKALLRMAAMPTAALGTKEAEAAPPAGNPEAVAPPKPVTGILLVAAEAVREAVVGREVLPL